MVNNNDSEHLNFENSNEPGTSVLAPEFFLKEAEKYPVIDVRTPAEFARGIFREPLICPFFRMRKGLLWELYIKKKDVTQRF